MGRAAARGTTGMSGVHTAMTNTRDTPVEALERALPMRVRRYTLRRGSGGAGAYPGGDGIERELEVLEPTPRCRSSPSAASARRGVSPAASRARRARTGCCPAATRRAPGASPDKCTVELEPGDVIRVLTPGGGGCGATADLIASLALLFDERSDDTRCTRS